MDTRPAEPEPRARRPARRLAGSRSRSASCSRAEVLSQYRQLAGDLQHYFATLVLAAQEEFHHASLAWFAEDRKPRIVLGLRYHRAFRKQGIAGKDRRKMPALVVAQLRDGVLFGFFGSEPRHESKHDSAIDDAPAIESRFRRVVAHLL